MRVFITGGTGFIGSRLALRCLELGHPVRVLGQENTSAEQANREEIEEGGAEVVIGSVTDRELLFDVIGDTDVVCHLAAVQHEMNVTDGWFREVNVGGTRNVLEAAERAGVRRFVHGSTIGVYGSTTGVVDEESPTIPTNIYGVTKLQGEDVVRSFRDRVPFVIVRIPEVYGPGDRRLLKLFRSIDRNVFFVIGRGQNVHHPIYIDDLLDGLLRVGQAPEAVGHTFLLAGKEAVTTSEMVAAVAEALGKSPPRLRVPLAPFLLVAILLEFGLRPLGVQPPLHRRRLDFFRKSFQLDASESERLLGFEPQIGFREGAVTTAEWYRSMGYL